MLIGIFRNVCLFLCAAVIAVTPTVAQEKKDADLAPVSEVERLVTLSTTDGTLNAIEQSLKSIMLNELAAQNPKILPQDKQNWQEVLQLVDTLIVQYVNGFKDILVESHRKNFTRDEIRELSRFFDSPIGRVYARKTESITRDVAIGVNALQQRLIDSAIQGGAELMKKRNKNKGSSL